MFQKFHNSVKQLVNFTDEELDFFTSFITPVSFSKKEFILRQGEICNHVMFLNRGALSYFLEQDGKEIIHEFFFDDCWITDYGSFLSRMPSHNNILVLEDTEVFMFEYDAIQKLYDTSKNFERFGRLIAEFIFVENERNLVALSSKTPEERYIQLLKERPRLFQRVPQYMIASFLNITPEALSRIRKRSSKLVY